MPSLIVGYVPGSGFTPLISGSIFSGFMPRPVGGIQLRADRNNSGNCYISLSGGWAFSGQVGLLVGSGGPTIQSGSYALSGAAPMDGMQLGPGDAYFVPSIAVYHQAVQSGAFGSGTIQVCVGADPVCSGPFARVYWEVV